MKFDVIYFFEQFPRLIVKVPFTFFLGTIAFILALFMGILLALAKNSRIRLIRGSAALYVSYFRSTPYITQLFILYFGLPQIIDPLKAMTAETALIISISMNSAAFISEIIRGGLLSVNKGQMEAAVSIGLTRFQALRKIIFPQAFVVALPGLGNSFISMLKSTAMGFTIGVVELLAKAKIGSATSYRYLESYMAVGIIYWGMMLMIGYFQKKLEKRVTCYL
ncbi:amino acid ABC transporter permease [Lachnospiraceae bacterium 50-23]|jgi:putative amino-acid transport system permease protein|nr:amino acid ABC transporter permease [Dorea sp.]